MNTDVNEGGNETLGKSQDASIRFFFFRVVEAKPFDYKIMFLIIIKALKISLVLYGVIFDIFENITMVKSNQTRKCARL